MVLTNLREAYRSNSPTTRSTDPTATTISARKAAEAEDANPNAKMAVWQADPSEWRKTSDEIEIADECTMPFGVNDEEDDEIATEPSIPKRIGRSFLLVYVERTIKQISVKLREANGRPIRKSRRLQRHHLRELCWKYRETKLTTNFYEQARSQSSLPVWPYRQTRLRWQLLRVRESGCSHGQAKSWNWQKRQVHQNSCGWEWRTSCVHASTDRNWCTSSKDGVKHKRTAHFDIRI